MINIPSIILISAVELLVFLIFVSSSSKTYALINPLINQVTISREILPSVATSSILAHPNHKVKNETRLTLRTLSSSRNRSRNRNRRKRQLESPSESLTKFSAPSRASSAFKFDPVTSSKEENFHSSSSYTFAPSSSSSSREEGSVRVLDRLNSDPETLYQSINLNSYQVPSSNYHSIPSSFGSSPGGVAANQEFESMSQYFEGRIGHGHRLDPIIDASTPRNITTASGKTVFLPCRIRHLGDRTISWIRKSDRHVLTVGKYTYTSDERFKAIHLDNSDDWTLQITFPTKGDADQYVCQISGSKDNANVIVNLSVLTSSARILGGPAMFVNSGSSIQLTCLVNHSLQPSPPDYVFWHHNGEVINYDSSIRGMKLETFKSAQETLTKLIIEKAHPNDSGNYSCLTSPYDFAEPAHIAVHVLLKDGGGHPEAIQHSGKRSPEVGGTLSTSSSDINPSLGDEDADNHHDQHSNEENADKDGNHETVPPSSSSAPPGCLHHSNSLGLMVTIVIITTPLIISSIFNGAKNVCEKKFTI